MIGRPTELDVEYIALRVRVPSTSVENPQHRHSVVWGSSDNSFRTRSCRVLLVVVRPRNPSVHELVECGGSMER
jgi:hypothetical protein